MEVPFGTGSGALKLKLKDHQGYYQPMRHLFWLQEI